MKIMLYKYVVMTSKTHANIHFVTISLLRPLAASRVIFSKTPPFAFSS